MKYLALSVGPIYRTITEVRKTRGIWASSYFFSWFIRQVLEKTKDDGFDIMQELDKGIEHLISVIRIDGSVLRAYYFIADAFRMKYPGGYMNYEGELSCGIKEDIEKCIVGFPMDAHKYVADILYLLLYLRYNGSNLATVKEMLVNANDKWPHNKILQIIENECDLESILRDGSYIQGQIDEKIGNILKLGKEIPQGIYSENSSYQNFSKSDTGKIFINEYDIKFI